MTQSNLKPSQQRSKRIPIGIRPEMHELLKEIAERNGRSIVGQVERWIKNTAETDTSVL